MPSLFLIWQNFLEKLHNYQNRKNCQQFPVQQYSNTLQIYFSSHSALVLQREFQVNFYFSQFQLRVVFESLHIRQGNRQLILIILQEHQLQLLTISLTSTNRSQDFYDLQNYERSFSLPIQRQEIQLQSQKRIQKTGLKIHDRILQIPVFIQYLWRYLEQRDHQLQFVGELQQSRRAVQRQPVTILPKHRIENPWYSLIYFDLLQILINLHNQSKIKQYYVFASLYFYQLRRGIQIILLSLVQDQARQD